MAHNTIPMKFWCFKVCVASNSLLLVTLWMLFFHNFLGLEGPVYLVCFNTSNRMFFGLSHFKSNTSHSAALLLGKKILLVFNFLNRVHDTQLLAQFLAFFWESIWRRRQWLYYDQIVSDGSCQCNSRGVWTRIAKGRTLLFPYYIIILSCHLYYLIGLFLLLYSCFQFPGHCLNI